jgi:hypothetical protein
VNEERRRGPSPFGLGGAGREMVCLGAKAPSRIGGFASCA